MTRASLPAALAAALLGALATAQDGSAGRRLAALIEDGRAFTRVPEPLFEALGWVLPDGGAAVRELAQAAEGGAFDPARLQGLPPERLGYRASWHVVRYRHYGLDWDITGLHLAPRAAVPGLPTVAIVHGGSANWYEFFVDPLNGPGLAQYLAQRVPVLLITIPGNYRPGGWTEDNASRRPAYLLDAEPSPRELRVRNAVYTFALVAEGVARLVEATTRGPLLLVGHSTGGELQFLLKERLRSRLQDRSLGWGTGGPASLRRAWESQAAAAGNRPGARRFPPVGELRGRGVDEYTRGYVGPLNPLAGGAVREVAERWFAREGRRRPHFKQPLQDLEHTAQVEQRDAIAAQIRAALAEAPLGPDRDAVVADLFSTMRSPTTGYRRMLFQVGAKDEGHWDEDPARARELFVAERFRAENPDAQVRVVVFDLPLTHYGHIERPRQLAGATLEALRWLAAGPR